MRTHFAKWAPALFVLLASSGFITAKYVSPYIAPFTFLAIRYLVAAVVLSAVAMWQGKWRSVSRSQLGQAFLVALCLHFAFTGGTFVAVQRGVPGAVVSVITSAQPIVVTLLGVVVLGERFSSSEGVGLLLGIAGVAVLVAPKGASGVTSHSAGAIGMVSAFVALAGASVGYMLQKRGGEAADFLAGTSIQYVITTGLFSVAALAQGDLKVILTRQLILGLAWSSLAISIGAIYMIFSLLKQGSAGRATSLYYLVPPATAVEACIMFGERITSTGMAGMAMCIAGVVMVQRASAI